MKKYDRVWVPSKPGNPHIRIHHRRDGLSPWVEGASVDVEREIIVMTIEEARRLFRAGYNRATYQRQPTFNKYLKNKGIQ